MTSILLAVSFIFHDRGRAGIFLDVYFSGENNHVREWVFSFLGGSVAFLSAIALRLVAKSNI